MTRTTLNLSWPEANQRVLMAELALVREALRRYTEASEGEPGFSDVKQSSPTELQVALDEARAALPAPAALDQLCTLFGLSRFERDTLLLCAGIELDGAFARQCAAAQGDERRSHPTFSLALASLPEPHWSALTPDAPLRYWGLIEVGAGQVLTTNPLRVDERILHFLTGVPGIDEQLIGCVELLACAEELAPSHRALADRVASVWSRTDQASPPVIQLCGRDVASKRHVAAAGCASLGLKLCLLTAECLPQTSSELQTLQRRWEREAGLSGAALLLDCGTGDAADAARLQMVRRWIERARGLLLVSTTEPAQGILRPCVSFEVRKSTAQEQRQVWEQALGTTASALNGHVDRLIAQFNLDAPGIRDAFRQASVLEAVPHSPLPQGETGEQTSIDPTALGAALWQVCRTQSRARLDDLAQRIHSAATWGDLVLPERTVALLREIAVHVRQRPRVYETWGFAAKSSRGLGISAMFSGPSGTGKTLAAEVLAQELELDLYRIDLSQVVSKYIGETEKNLRRVFDAAEESGAVLLFDEADALFGKRSEVKDSHDRYANIEVSYLLQRMEAYRGLAVLTTNMKDALDPAFLRRIRFVVQFPFPDATLRSEIWRRVFPTAAPTEDLDLGRLSRLNVAGGNIRNIALNAAFLAAEAREPMRMHHLLAAARTEYAKLERTLTDAEGAK